MQLKGKTALITGAAKRIGKCIALELAKHGADIIVHYNQSENEARACCQEIKALGVDAHALQADLSDMQQLQTLQSEAGRIGNVDILINNAATFQATPLGSVTLEDWDHHILPNLRAPFFLSQHFGRKMYERGYGKIINLADHYATAAAAKDYTPYSISKAGIISLTQCLALALAPHVHVNAIAPGPILFPEGYSEEKKQTVINSKPLKRQGAPQDIANATRFLLQEADYTTGDIMHVNGGQHL